MEHLNLLVDELPIGQVYPDLGDNVSIIPCWKFNDWKNPFRIAKAVKALPTDAVILNLQFASFGDKKLPAGLGLCLPLLLKGLGVTTITLLHNIMETVDLRTAGYATHPTQEWLTRMGGKLATRMLLCAAKLSQIDCKDAQDDSTQTQNGKNACVRALLLRSESLSDQGKDDDGCPGEGLRSFTL